MSFLLEAACCCHMGKIRKNNEDNFLFDRKCLKEINDGLPIPAVMETVLRGDLPLAVFDGMGGANNGEAASYTAAVSLYGIKKNLSDYLIPENKYLQNVCCEVNEAVVAREEELCTEYMGSTVVMFYFTRRSVYACNLGDSRAYLLRKGEFRQLSEDHVESREGSKKKKQPLTQYLGISPELYRLEPCVVRETLQDGDQYLLCSDGLTDMLSDSEIAEILANTEYIDTCAKMLVQSALDHGGRDNITVIVCRVHNKGWPQTSAKAAPGGVRMDGTSTDLVTPGGATDSGNPGTAEPKKKWRLWLLAVAAAAILLFVLMKTMIVVPPEPSPPVPTVTDTIAVTPACTTPTPTPPAPVSTLAPALDASPVSGLEISEDHFPDESFRSYLSKTWDKDCDGVLTFDEQKAVDSICFESPDLWSLEGIECFPNLSRVDLGHPDVNRPLMELDLSRNTNLSFLNCSRCRLTGLDLSKNTKLEYLNCSFNELAALNVTQNTSLEHLECNFNKIDKLDLSQNSKLDYLDCEQNRITSLDMRQNMELESLFCGNQPLADLSISGLKSLSKLHCVSEALKELDISLCPYLIRAYENSTTMSNGSMLCRAADAEFLVGITTEITENARI